MTTLTNTRYIQALIEADSMKHGETSLTINAAHELATYQRLAEAWEQYFQAEEIKNRQQGKKSWTWAPFFKSAEDKARAALKKLETLTVYVSE